MPTSQQSNKASSIWIGKFDNNALTKAEVGGAVATGKIDASEKGVSRDLFDIEVRNLRESVKEVRDQVKELRGYLIGGILIAGVVGFLVKSLFE